MSSKGSVPRLFPLSRRFTPGDLIGAKYRLTEQIGAGAMGAVWTARNELLDIDVAVKLLRVDNQRADPDRLYKRLLQEARAAARLGHPGIVRVFDFGQAEDGSPFIVMELLEGESLADVMARKRRTDAIEAVQLILPLIDALAMAHGRGIVHRDIKPENIFLSRDEYGRLQPKIVDFGVARFAEGGRSMTKSGALLGTPDYMAPEQARGEADIDHRVDIWALCIVLYELVSGDRPFARESANYLAVLRAIVHEQPPSIVEKGVCDDALWLILERGLRKRRNERWDTMRVLGEALALWLYERGVREDALGASLKTTWLQSGIDGVKIDTSSMSPPRPDEDSEPLGAKDAHSVALPPDARLPSISVVEEPLRTTASYPAPAVLRRSDASPSAAAPPRSSIFTWIAGALLFCAFAGGAALWGKALSPETSAWQAPGIQAVVAPEPQSSPVRTAAAPDELSRSEPDTKRAPTETPKEPEGSETTADEEGLKRVGEGEGASNPSAEPASGVSLSAGTDSAPTRAKASPPSPVAARSAAAQGTQPALDRTPRKPRSSGKQSRSAESYDFGF